MERELKYLGHVLESPERPFVAILGGAKVSDKIEVIQNLLGRVNRLLIGGAMAYTFLKSRGLPVGRSLVEDDKLDAARAIDEHRLVWAVAELQPEWQELERYSGPLPPQAVRALEIAGELAACSLGAGCR